MLLIDAGVSTMGRTDSSPMNLRTRVWVLLGRRAKDRRFERRRSDERHRVAGPEGYVSPVAMACPGYLLRRISIPTDRVLCGRA
jgi:hypothetical protein